MSRSTWTTTAKGPRARGYPEAGQDMSRMQGENHSQRLGGYSE